MSEQVKAALIASVALLPVFLGIGWIADILTRASIGMIVVSHGGDPKEVVGQSIIGTMWPVMIIMWLIASGIVLLLAYLEAIPSPHVPEYPKPPVWKDPSNAKQKASSE